MNNKENKIFVGIVCILLSCFGFAAMQLFIKLAGNIPSIQKTFFRNLIAAIIAFVPLIKSKPELKMMEGNWSLLILRSILGTVGMILNFIAVEYISIGDASMLQKLSPFFVIILSLIFLKERVLSYQWIAVIVAFIGALFVIKPSGTGLPIGAIAGVLGAALAGGAYTCLRSLTLKGVKGAFIIFFFSAFSCISVLPFIIFSFVPMTLTQIFYLLMVGVAAALGQFGITFAYSFAPARNISVFEYSQILFASLLGFFVLSEIPDTYSIIGYVIIISVGIYMILRGARDGKSGNK